MKRLLLSGLISLILVTSALAQPGMAPGMGPSWYGPTWTYNPATGILTNSLGELGLEINDNPGFDSDTGWTHSGAWTITGGVATCDGTTTPIYQNKLLSSNYLGRILYVSIDIISRSAGSIHLELGNYANSPEIYTPGNYNYSLFEDEPILNRPLIRSTGFNGSVDNFSVKPQYPKNLFFTKNFGSLSTVTAKTAINNATSIGSLGFVVGTVIRLDSQSDPLNYFSARLQASGKVSGFKFISGLATPIITSVTVTLVDNATLDVVDNGTTVKIYYNNAQVGATYTKVAGDPSGPFMGPVIAGPGQVNWPLCSYGP